ncbi:unnamed protein product [Rhizophagus irregularis]|uniref:Uncharacterized protein n=2 Tax=Rhizophagus irregularis TaxID=588596 RepID=U9SKC3_RHIID|nr:hypothetical protein GLOIN_2v1774757 [Rhizophagus irregularis DAOM 181602=DAOM 197198]PKC72963.1 hypothetical protein RhiirA1_451711 [Rhizophagus irregularis]POG71527.1 hypothetical protein GLOIN_2v1774757 [Rhizophagus irregularis DAOM 181602=DAOM 197198]CAB4387693.1 unnamed protein product [Rhizophagus irregularis]CAB4420220.1 unnamed protein product [Rhizophagus irregularis]GET51281.1 BTB/POZ domain-containing protein [Rhizophagus irregularis DAOM 181602=DAOM 197198]|eukprot:XP_025178393.1 hypothetical protein GLOIN_2v1774757 [Rhizophagus irregularis DAOM 181602=DAOM 197198]
MNYELTQNLSKDTSNLVKDTSVHDSNYFKKAFSEQWARKEEEFFISNQPNISPTVFEVLIKLIVLNILAT